MTGYETLFLVAVAVYLAECIAWVPDGRFVFRARPKHPWTPALDLFGVLLGRWRGAGAGWRPGAGGVAIAESSPPGLAPGGICACGSSGGATVRYEDLGKIEAEGVRVRARGRVVAWGGTAEHARQLAALMVRLAAADPAARPALIRAEHDRLLDRREARRRVARHAVCAPPLRRVSAALGLVLFVALPPGLVFGGPLVAAGLLVVALALAALAIVRYRALLRRAAGHPPSPERVATMALLPIAAARADDFLARDLFGGLHALPLAREAARPEEARALAAAALRRLRHPTVPERVACCEGGAWVAAEWGVRLERWIVAEHGPAATLLAPPARETADCRSYCPRCVQQFAQGGGDCPDCPGVALAPLGA